MDNNEIVTSVMPPTEFQVFSPSVKRILAFGLSQMARSHIKRISEQVACAQVSRFDFLGVFLSDRRQACRHSYHIPGKVQLLDGHSTRVPTGLQHLKWWVHAEWNVMELGGRITGTLCRSSFKGAEHLPHSLSVAAPGHIPSSLAPQCGETYHTLPGEWGHICRQDTWVVSTLDMMWWYSTSIVFLPQIQSHCEENHETNAHEGTFFRIPD